ncbi:hypothetical protein C5L33_000074 [Lactobacillus pasteurii]|uniref:Lactobacillus pasteurii CRBIP 24.76 WGS project CAKD00000000 data, contig 9 n=1 Tax=Lactobacillus pasteurii DSM 23907 = CRBIP 24.76 TaxID=1423790 RepID=I7JXI4_9LACO|nr:hypothetical protein C5L33_000074 [Lactobacillus pasteurii]CCI84660.1 unnamed protein product [Lactobacillus pasteurii DSM 23907 = CRBIP 24.76]
MMPKDILRKEILSLKGIGPETADVILMYALSKGGFVVDAYWDGHRQLAREGLQGFGRKRPSS